jgi:hypothetical protein
MVRAEARHQLAASVGDQWRQVPLTGISMAPGRIPAAG